MESDRRWLLSDFGGVLSLYQSDDDSRRMAAICGMDWPVFKSRYWENRPPYDAGDISAMEYWRIVLRRNPTAAEAVALMAVDLRSWLNPNEDALVVYRELRPEVPVAILSNAPVELAEVMPSLPWMPEAEVWLFSCYLHVVKPDSAIYRRTLDALDAKPENVLLVDDREENIWAAQQLGLQAYLYRSGSGLREAVARFLRGDAIYA